MKELPDLRSLVLPAGEGEAFVDSLRGRLTPEECARIGAVFEGLSKLAEVLEQKKLSIARLRELVFGAKTESARKLCGRASKERPAGGRRPGHGRRSQRNYTGARRIRVPHGSLKAGQECPRCRRGKLRTQKQPATSVQLSAQAPVAAVIHEMERLRCDTCGELFTATAPPEAGREKFDLSVGVLVGLLRYGSGMPFHRLERLQESVGVPLPASVQWEQALRISAGLEAVAVHLVYLGAQRAVFHNDDTTMRIAALRREIQAESEADRTGIFTTGIVCEGAEPGSPSIRLVFTGRRHAGENLAQVLDERESGSPVPLQMCDGLDRNLPRDHTTELCHCMVHARRQFIEIRTAFPGECQRVVETLGVVYKIDAQCRKERVDASERLRRHQERSRPVLEALRQELTDAVRTKKVEPNSALGGAIHYLEKRWESLTRFLTTPGAPIDNNVAERLLKSSILHRKNSMHYRTQRGAEVGDRFMTIIETCRANAANPFDYMLAVVRNQDAVAADPGRWMPWNYREALMPAATEAARAP